MHTRRSARSARSARALAGLLLAAGLALTGCGAGDADSGDSTGESKSRPGAGAQDHDREGAPGGGAAGSHTADRKPADGARGSAAPKPSAHPDRIIRTASLSVRVEDVPEALDEARAAAEDAGGYVGEETTTADGDGHERTRVVLRVPVDRYEAVLTGLEGAGRLLARTAEAQDVGDRVVDVESRIASQRASVARIRELMERATKLSDVVTLEGELSTRQADLESLLAQRASLKDRTSLATITLSLSERPVRKAEAKDGEPGFGDALAGGWGAFVSMLRWLLVVLGAVLPFAVAAGLLVLGWLGLVRPARARRRESAPAVAAPGPLSPAPAAPERAGAESPSPSSSPGGAPARERQED